MRAQTVLLCIGVVCFLQIAHTEAKTVFRRTDKISENFKQLELPAEEIDPDVAPPEPQKIETIDPADVAETGTGVGTGSVSAVEDEIVDESEGAVANEVIDEAANEVDTGGAAAAVTSAPVAAPPAATTAAPVATTPVKNENDQSPISKYCKCTDSHCDCCRNFGLPLIPVRGPGCAKITYLGNEKMSVSIKYGDITLATRTISGKNAKPICVGLPGGYSKFCGRVYGLSKAKEDFKACLGFELRSEDEVEAALRVSCFKFGPEGLKVAEAEPLPSEINKDEDDDDDIFGFAAGGDDDDEDDYEEDETEAAETDDDDEDYEDDEPAAEAPEDADYGGFSLGGLLAELADDDDEATVTKKPATVSIVAQTVGATRTVDKAQRKDNAAAPTAEATHHSTDAADAVVTTVQDTGTAAAEVTPSDEGATTVKTKKGKKAKKNKKKKTADTESDFAFQLISGILEFFN